MCDYVFASQQDYCAYDQDNSNAQALTSTSKITLVALCWRDLAFSPESKSMCLSLEGFLESLQNIPFY